MRAVNLLPKDLQQRKSLRQEDPAVVVGSALGVVVMIALAAAFLTAHGKANAQERRLNAARLELAELSLKKRPTPPPTKPSEPITPIVPPPAVTGQEASWLTAVSTALSQRIAFDRVLREVSLVMPEDVTLSSMTMTAPTGVAGALGAATAQGFVISGSAYSYDSVARLLSRLALVPDLSSVTLTGTNSGSGESPTGATPTAGVQFNISAALKGAVAAPTPTTTAPAAPATTDTTATTGEVSS
jgi:hypothetical protein